MRRLSLMAFICAWSASDTASWDGCACTAMLGMPTSSFSSLAVQAAWQQQLTAAAAATTDASVPPMQDECLQQLQSKHGIHRATAFSYWLFADLLSPDGACWQQGVLTATNATVNMQTDACKRRLQSISRVRLTPYSASPVPALSARTTAPA
jgi:hypothetical protein